jgi:hypothetical protein
MVIIVDVPNSVLMPLYIKHSGRFVSDSFGILLPQGYYPPSWIPKNAVAVSLKYMGLLN